MCTIAENSPNKIKRFIWNMLCTANYIYTTQWYRVQVLTIWQIQAYTAKPTAEKHTLTQQNFTFLAIPFPIFSLSRSFPHHSVFLYSCYHCVNQKYMYIVVFALIQHLNVPLMTGIKISCACAYTFDLLINFNLEPNEAFKRVTVEFIREFVCFMMMRLWLH